jgi:carboxypeptidase family protein
MRSTFLRFAYITLLWLGSAGEPMAQSAQVTGRVADASDSVVPGATVTVVSETTGLSRIGVSNAEGYYAVPSLPPVIYRVTAELIGFSSVTRTGLTLVAEQNARLDFVLSVGAVAEQVSVTAAALLDSTDRTSCSTVRPTLRATEHSWLTYRPWMLLRSSKSSPTRSRRSTAGRPAAS